MALARKTIPRGTMLNLTSQKEVGLKFRQRTRFLMALATIVFLLLGARLYFLQILQGDRFAYLAENNRIRLKKLPGIRGMIFDRRGQLLVDNRPSFDLHFVPEDSPEPSTTVRELAGLLGRDDGELLKTVSESNGQTPFQGIVLGRDVDWDTVVAVETHKIDLPGVVLRIRPRRSYLTKTAASHLLGYIGEIGPKQLSSLKENGYEMGDEIGQFGLEKTWEEYLRGRSGGQQVEVDVLGRSVRVLGQMEDVPGQSIYLTLDRDLQETGSEVLDGKQGSIVVLDVWSGAILALVSSPGFDPNVFARGITVAEWQDLLNDKTLPLNNRAIQGQYAPGSTFKVIVALAALQEDLIQPESRIFCPGYQKVGGRAFKDWKKEGHGWVDLNRAIAESCNIYFYQVGQRIGVDRIAKYARLFGLGEKTGIALEGEKSGLIPDSEWKKKRFGQPWFPGETPSVAIGQGYVTVTPVQMATFMAAVANGGKLYRPWIVRKVESVDGMLIREYGPEEVRSVVLKENTLKLIRNALRDVVNGRSGTGGKARSNLIQIAGKTGTAQVLQVRRGSVKREQFPYEIGDHAWFVAYAPADNPEIAVAVVVEHGGGGGAVAAPLAKTVIEKYAELKNPPADARLAHRNGEIGGHR